MITPAEIKKKASNKYKAYLQSIVEGETFKPIVIVGNKLGIIYAYEVKETTFLLIRKIQ